MTRILLTLVSTLFLLTSFSLKADNKELKTLLSAKEVKRLESAEKLIKKGDAYIESAQDFEKEIEALKNADGRVKSGKINKLNKKIAQKKVQASLFYQDGYKKYIDVLDDHLKELEKSGNSVAKQTRDDSKSLEKKARKLYNKAENMSSAEKMVELIELAQENQNKAIDLQSKCLISLIDQNQAVEEELMAEASMPEDTVAVMPLIVDEPKEELALQTDTTLLNTPSVQSNLMVETTPPPAATPSIAVAAAIPVTDVASADSLMVAPPVETVEAMEPPVEEAPVVEPAVANPDVFLTIQFMADRKKANNEQIASLYSGNKEVIEMNVNDWFKYSVGKYQNLEQAKADMQAENIKGFIVAYNKKQRISVKEAVSILNGES